MPDPAHAMIIDGVELRPQGAAAPGGNKIVPDGASGHGAVYLTFMSMDWVFVFPAAS